jgi:hypothetical protein
MNLFHPTAFFCIVTASPLQAQSTISTAKPYAYGANCGWIHFRPSAADGVRVMEWYLQGRAYGANTGWIDLGDGTPGALWQYTNTPGDYGVNHDSAGRLSGWGYSANTGWINFSWTIATDVNTPRFLLTTGAFTGYAWSANMGWINLGAGTLQTNSISRPDSDGDGLGDIWELAYAGNLTTLTGTGDNDGDGQTNREEYLTYSNPFLLDQKDPLRILGVQRAIDGDGPITFTHLNWLSRENRFYTVETSTTLAPGSWTPADDHAGTGGFIDIFQYGTGHPAKNFFRVSAKLPLP